MSHQACRRKTRLIYPPAAPTWHNVVDVDVHNLGVDVDVVGAGRQDRGVGDGRQDQRGEVVCAWRAGARGTRAAREEGGAGLSNGTG